MSLFQDWLHDPQASAAIAIGLVAATWALAQFRPLARERRRETYEAMTTHYGDLQSLRQAAVGGFPPLIAFGRRYVSDAARAQLDSPTRADVGRQHLAQILSDAQDWSRYGLAFTSAREVLDSEAKFRALLWAVEQIRQWPDDGPLVLDEGTFPPDVRNAAKDLVHDLNAFLFHYENGNYPARQTLGLLHRSLAIASKMAEPVVWASSLEGRYGRRILRIGLAAQHFNDVTAIHCTSDISWKCLDGTRREKVHPRLKRSVVGTSVLVSDTPVRPRLLPGVRLRARTWYWYLVGLVSPAPKLWFLSYGGWRLHRHRRSENRLAGLLSVALLGFTQSERTYSSLKFDWTLDSLRAEQEAVVREERRGRGRLSWLWLPKPRGGVSGNE